jgi:hypothetical protein
MMNSSKATRYLVPGLGIILGILLILAWFPPLNNHVFMGDDLNWMKAYNSLPASRGFLANIVAGATVTGKLRPVSSALILLSTALCRSNYDCYVFVNYAILLLNAILIAVCAYLVSRRWWPSAALAAVAVILSRCAYFAVLQVIGLMENISITFVLLFTVAGIKFIGNPARKWLWLSLQILFFLLALCSHERFIVLVVPLVLSIVLESHRFGRLAFYVALASVFVVTSGYLLVKQFAFHASIFTGTQNTSVLSTFSLPQFLSFLGQGFLNLIGFNMGPSGWSGEYLLDAGPGGILVGVFLTGALIALIVVLIRQRVHASAPNQFDMMAYLVVLIGALLVSASVTFRQEYRWLYAPFVAFILLVCLLLGWVSDTRTRWILTVLIAVAFASVDVFYRPFVQQNFVFQIDTRIASAVKTNIIKTIGKSRLEKQGLYLVTNGNSYLQSWILEGDYFFKFYANNGQIPVHYVDSLQALPANLYEDGSPLVFQISGDSVARVPDSQVQEVLSQKDLPPSATVEYDFAGNFRSGIVNPSNLPGTSEGRAAFVADLADAGGGNNQGMVLPSGSSIHFPSVPCAESSHLVFRAAMPDASRRGANVYVDIQAQGTTRRLADISLEPPTRNQVVSWLDYNIPIPECTGDPIGVTISVISPAGDRQAGEVALSGVQLVTTK